MFFPFRVDFMHLHFLFNLPLMFNFCEYYLDIDNCQAPTAKVEAAGHVEILFSQRRNSLVLLCMLVIYILSSASAQTGRDSSVDSMSVSYASRLEIDPDVILLWNFFPSADSRRASCQLLAKEWELNAGKLPLGGLPRNSVVK